MRTPAKSLQRRVLGRVSLDTKGPPGSAMEVAGLWNQKDALTH